MPKRNDRLKKEREARSWTQRGLAEMVGVSEKAVRAWESGERGISLPSKARLVRVFGLTAEELGFASGGERVEEEQEGRAPNQRLALDGPLDFQAGSQKMRRELGKPLEQLGLQVAEANENEEKHTQEVPSSSGPLDKNRQRMLTRVESRWLSGVLDRLSDVPLIALDFQILPDAVASPWLMQMQEPYTTASLHVPAGTQITEVFDQADGELLILGEPGAGKTTLLLKLTRDLVKRAQLDENHPIPVIFNLSSWSEKRLSFKDWMIEELETKYQIPQKLALAWIVNDQILPLLDGLDEVDALFRSACVETINTYRLAHGWVPLVICCRMADYHVLPARLILNQAIEVQPLTINQIDEHLSKGGGNLAPIRIALQADPILQEMVSTPLMLSVLLFTYQGIPIEEVPAGGSVNERRQFVLKKYVERVFQRKGQNRYTLDQTAHWLTWLARHMQQNNLTEFYIERMQPDWLESNTHRSYRDTIIRIVFGLNLLINAALFGAFMSDSIPDQSGVSLYLNGKGWGVHILGWMAPGLGGGLRGGGSLEIIVFIVDVVAALIVGRSGLPPITPQFLQRVALNGLRNGLLFGGIIALFTAVLFGVTEGLATGIYRALGTGVFEGLLVGLMTGLIAGLRYERGNASKEQKKQKLFRERSLIDRLKNFVIFGVCSGIGTASTYALFSGGYLIAALVYGLVVSVACGILFGLGNGTELVPNLGLSIEPAESVAWSWPSVVQNFASNVKKGLPIAGAILILMVVVLGCAGQAYYGMTYAWRYGLVYGSIIGIVTGVAAILTGVLNSGWSSSIIDEKQRMQPNEGIQNSLKNAFFAAGLFGTIGAIAGGLTSGLSFQLAGVPGWPVLLLGMILAFGAIFAFRFWTAYGGNAFIEHYVLRWCLWRAGSIPWKYVRFLDYATERTLLRKIGGGYIFAHRLIMEYFASLSDQPE